MNEFIRFTDAVTGHIYLPEDNRYTVTKDSSSKSGHSVIAQIQMTHAGIVTLNRGFYLPVNMKDGSTTFNKNYDKPVLVGHDADTDPVGRVVAAKYIDTSSSYTQNDKILNRTLNFVDGKKDVEKTIETVQHIIKEYCGKDSYRGMGHILGTLKITEEETIAKILDKRYLTVSTSMSSNRAICSECGQDWMSEGPCEHERGKTYDSKVPMALIPGTMSYNHVGIVSEPADPFAAGFNLLEISTDGKIKKLDQIEGRDFVDSFSLAANLFSYNNSSLISLSDKKQIDLLEVKNNIQEIQDSLNQTEKQMSIKKTLDSITAVISLYSCEEETGKTTSIELRQYLKTLSQEELANLAAKALGVLDSQEISSEEQFEDSIKTFIESEMPKANIDETATQTTTETNPVPVMEKVKTLNDKFKVVDGKEFDVIEIENVKSTIMDLKDAEITEKDAALFAATIVKAKHGDIYNSLIIDTNEKEIKDLVVELKVAKANQFKLSDMKPEDILAKMNERLDDADKITEVIFADLTKKQFAGSGSNFPITSKSAAIAAKKVLGLAICGDSLKARILSNIEKIASTLTVKTTEDKNSTESTQENFDTRQTECDNQNEISNEKVLEDLKSLLKLADDKGIISDVIAPYMIDKNQEIEILEQQLELVNEEFDSLQTEIQKFRDEAKKTLIDQIVDTKIKKGLVKVEQRDAVIAEHLTRTDDSLKDTLKDLETIVNVSTKVEPKIGDNEKIVNPVLQDKSELPVIHAITETKEVKVDNRDEKIQQKYSLLRAQKGKQFADSWLSKQY